MKVLNVLIACEESQRVCKEFRALGHNAFSCDIEPCSGGHPEWHIQCDVLEVINPNAEVWGNRNYTQFYTQDGLYWLLPQRTWDLIIAHPPCTYLSNVAAPHLFKGSKNGERKIADYWRYEQGLKAKEFFMQILNAECEHIAVENPTPMTIFELPKYDCVVQPFEHGDPFQKRTCLWLKNLPPIKPTNIVKGEPTTKAGNWYNKAGKDRQKIRSKTFPGIAKAIAKQYSEYLTNG